MPEIQDNWLNHVDLGTYNFTLYLVTAEIWNDPTPLSNDDNVINNNSGQGAIIIAQSGVTGGFGLDNVIMASVVDGSTLTGGIASSIIQFELNEPLGFTLLDKILRLKELFSFDTMQSAHYVLKLEFRGRNISSGRIEQYPGVFLYPLMLQYIDASVTAAGTKYSIVGNCSNVIAANSVVTTMQHTITGITTVKSFTNKVAEALNKQPLIERDLADNNVKGLPASVTIEFAESATWLKESKWIGNETNTTGDNSGSDGLPHVDIDIGIKVSTWLVDQITRNTPELGTKIAAADTNKKPMPIIRVEPKITYRTGVKQDPETKQPMFDVTYIIHISEEFVPAKTPERDVAYLESSSSRYDTLQFNKKYSYLYSGENTDVINFDLNFNNMFFVARYPMDGRASPTVDNNRSITDNSKNSQNTTPGKTARKSVTGGYMLAAYLEDIELDESVIIETQQYMYTPMSLEQQYANNRSGDINILESIRVQELANREGNSLEINLSIKGDPFWLGIPGGIINKISAGNSRAGQIVDVTSNLTDFNYKRQPIIAFVTYNPISGVAEPRGPGAGFEKAMDLASSGLYSIFSVESKFQNGMFTQELKGFRLSGMSTYKIKDKLEKL